MKNLIIFCPYPPGEAPSQRFRFEQYLDLLRANNFKITLLPFYNQSAWKALNEANHIVVAVHVFIGIIRQFLRIARSVEADYILIHREILPLGPPIIEWTLAKILKKKIIYDFDDAIWLTDKTNEPFWLKVLKYRKKVRLICKWSYRVSCGNEYLGSYATRYNKNVIINPTTIDTDGIHNRVHYRTVSRDVEKLTIGWTGSYSTLKYLESLQNVFQRIEEKYPNVSLLVVADKPPKLQLKNLLFRKWSKETEIEDLCCVDIGIMPLPDDEWTKGKCGFKALQYLALCIPALVSPVAVNKQIIIPGINGYWCETEKEWISCITLLLENKKLCRELGTKGREIVEAQYSVMSNTKNFLSLFR